MKEINQTCCLIATGGHVWMKDYFDNLPVTVRERLRQSPFNLCPAYLQTEVLPKLQRQYRSRERALFASVEVMERQVFRAERAR